MGDDAAAQVLSLIKLLRSWKKSSRLLNDQKKRSRGEALRLLETWLPSQPNITDDIMKKLWKGFLDCVWDAYLHSCGRLIDRLFSLLPRLHNPSISLHYFSTFLLTVRCEWPNIDGLRLEKLKLLIRRFLHYSFAFLKIHSWDLDLTSHLISILEDTCFSVKQDNNNSFGFSDRIASVFLEELKPFLPLRPEVLEVVFEPFISVLGSVPDDVLIENVTRSFFDVLLEMGNKLLEIKKLGNEVHDNDDAVVLGTIPLTMGFSSKLLEFGFSDEYCECYMDLSSNYHVMSNLYSQFLKLEKDLESSGIQVSNPRGTDMEDDVASACELPKTKVNDTVSKKRKRAESSKMIVATYYDAFHSSFKPMDIILEGCGLHKDFQGFTKKTGPEFSDHVYRVLPKNIDFYYSDGMLWNTEHFDPPKLDKIPHTQDEACRNTVVALKIFLSSGKHSKWIVGSGAVISEDGLVLTCAHLLHDYENPKYCLKYAKVVFFDGKTYMAKVIAKDVGKDLALLKIYAPYPPGGLKLSHAPLATAQEIKTGMNVYMILNTHYFLVFQLTEGTIRFEKSLYRDLEFKSFLKLDHDTAIIQTDIDCEKGNFGGPLFNSDGKIMGVQFADTGTSKLGIHVESISIFLDKYYLSKKKILDKYRFHNIR